MHLRPWLKTGIPEIQVRQPKTQSYSLRFPVEPVSGPSEGREGHRFQPLRRFSVIGTKSYHSFSLRLQFPVFAVVQTHSFAFYRKGQNLYEPCAPARTFSNIDFQSNFSIRVNLFSNKLDLSESATHDPMYSNAYTIRHLNLWYGLDDSRNLMLRIISQ